MHVEVTAILSDADGTFALPVDLWIPPHRADKTDVAALVREHVDWLRAQGLPVVENMTTVRVVSDERKMFERAWYGSN